MSNLNEALSRNLKIARSYLGWSQKDLAEKLLTSQSTYSQYEVCARLPRVERLVELAQALGQSLDGLLGLAPLRVGTSECGQQFISASNGILFVCGKPFGHKGGHAGVQEVPIDAPHVADSSIGPERLGQPAGEHINGAGRAVAKDVRIASTSGQVVAMDQATLAALAIEKPEKPRKGVVL